MLSSIEPITATIDLDALSAIAVEIHAIQRRVTRDLIRVGELFERAKTLLPVGTFLRWCQSEFPNLSPDSIEHYRLIYTLHLQTPEIIDAPPTVVYSLRGASKAVTDAVMAYYNELPPETPTMAVVVTTRAVAQISTRYELSDPGVISGLTRLPPDELLSIKATGVIQPGDEQAAVNIRDEPGKVARALQQLTRERRDIAIESKAGLDLFVRYDDQMGYVIAGFESQEQAERWISRKGK